MNERTRNAPAQATQIANFGTALSGVTTVPNDVNKYGVWAGRILVGVPASGTVLAVNAQGQSTSHQFGLNPSDLKLIPANENFFAVDTAAQNLGRAR